MTTADGATVDASALAARLRSEGLDVTGTVALSRIGLGHSNLTYLASDEAGRRWIVRRPPLGNLLASAHDVEREHQILAALGDTEVPVPRTFARAERGVLADTPVIVMECVDGQVIDGLESMGALPDAVHRALVDQLAVVLAAVHAVDLDEVGLNGLASHAPYAPRQIKRWSAQWSHSRTRELTVLDDLTDLLRRHVPAQAEVCLIHGDFSPRNLIIDPGTGHVRAVLDWELSTLGDPIADIGTLLAYWTVADSLATPTVPVWSQDDRRTFVRRYLELSDRDSATVAYWHALGLWKLAIITEGVLRRAHDEPHNIGERGVPAPTDIDELVDMGLSVARSAALT